jgi:hypothetical protein
MNYDTLTAQIIAYANRGGSIEFAAAIPYFIEMGQQKIWKELNTTGFQKTTQLKKFQVNNATIEKPADWQETISIIYGSADNFFINNVVLFPRSYEFCINYWPNVNLSDAANPPLFYSDYQPGQENVSPYKYYLIVPTPDKEYNYQITYIGRPNLITNENQTNILTDYYPDLLFYAAFLEALIYLKDDQRMPVYTKLYQESLTSANNLTKDRYIDRSVKRDVG